MRLLIVLALLALTAPARAEEGLYAGEQLFRPPVEWSTWIRAAVGGERRPVETIARGAATRSEPSSGLHGELGLGLEASLSISPRGNTRIGAWAELRGVSADGVFAGGELILTRVPKRLDMFFYEGHGILALRAGRSTTEATASIAYGYLAPFHLEGACKERFYGIETGYCAPRPESTTRYMAGLRLVGTVTRAIDDPRAWSATIGIEFEPVAALRMLLVARSWY